MLLSTHSALTSSVENCHQKAPAEHCIVWQLNFLPNCPVKLEGIHERMPFPLYMQESGSHAHLDTVDVHTTHTPTAVHEKDEFSVALPEVGLDRPQIRTEVQHDHWVVRDVLVEPLPDDFCLQQPTRKSVQAVDVFHLKTSKPVLFLRTAGPFHKLESWS